MYRAMFPSQSSLSGKLDPNLSHVLRAAPQQERRMAVKLVVALTDPEWFQHLRGKPDLDEVNFWAPSGRSFRALTAGEVFLFRLHAPYRVIVGGGIFLRADILPCWLAW